jgi:putative CocE/NonD family hydrolase
MPPTLTREIAKLRYMTEPLHEEVTVVGPSAFYLYASIDQEDTNWFITLKDVGPDSFVRSGASGRTTFPPNMPERNVASGYLKASHRWFDPKRSTIGQPWRPLRKRDQKPVVPGEITEYVIEMASCANVFSKGHRIGVEICSMNMPSGTAGFTNSKITLHKVYRNEKYPSHILLPVIPKGTSK